MDSPPLSPRQRRFQARKTNESDDSPPHLSKRRKYSTLNSVTNHLTNIPTPASGVEGSPSTTVSDNDQHQYANTSTHSELYQFASNGTQFDGDENIIQLGTVVAHSPPVPGMPLPEASNSYATLEDITHNTRLAIQAEMIRGKGTEVAYTRHVNDYISFWHEDQAVRTMNDSTYQPIPCFPITAMKVAVYLAYATKRGKRGRDGVEIEGTTLGSESIKQMISALEHHRRTHQHEKIYRDCNESHLPLRNDERITTFEKASKTTESQLIADSERNKALGTSNDTYTDEELIRAAMWFMRSSGNTKLQIHTGIRDRTMLLISTTTAYRGDSTRRIMWSDLKTKVVSLLDVGPDATETALLISSNQGKSNTSGRIDVQAALRHRHPELCMLGALGFYFFSRFHILDKPPPEYAPIYTHDDPQDMGTRAWYGIRLFPGAEDHRKRVNTMKLQTNIEITKVTHAGRPYAATTAREHGASRDDTKELGGWSLGGSYSVYDRTLPIEAMLGAAGFNARKQETYMVARSKLIPPSDMANTLFPWIEAEEVARQERRKKHGKRGEDIALKNFLELLVHLRSVILQDAAVLSVKYPECTFFQHPPFSTTAFREWAHLSTTTIDIAEEQSRLKLEVFPDHVVESLRGVLNEGHIQQQLESQATQSRQNQLQNDIDTVKGLLEALVPLASRRRPRQSSTSMYSRSPTSPPTLPPPEEASSTPTSIVESSCAAGTPELVLRPGPPVHSTTGISPAVSQRGTIYPSIVFPLSKDLHERDQQIAAINLLESSFLPDRLKRHTFEWKVSNREWLPYYQWWKPNSSGYPSVRQVWMEHEVGLDGQLSIRELNAGWDARWKRNKQNIKSEYSRRAKIITLVQELAAKPNWNSTIALRFLEAKYPIPTPTAPYLKSMRVFIEHLQKTGGSLRAEILDAAKSYPE